MLTESHSLAILETNWTDTA